MKSDGTWRFLLIATVLAGTAGLLDVRDKTEVTPKHQPLSSLPVQLGKWTGHDQPISDAVLSVLGPGEFVSRMYTQITQPSIGLFLAYLPSQRTGDTIHSPKNCLPAAGWMPVESSQIMIPNKMGPPISANSYVISKGLERQLVIYWYQAHGRTIASEYWARFYLVADAMRLNRTDGALVRLTTLIAEGETSQMAQKRVLNFAQQIIPSLGSYIPL